MPRVPKTTRGLPCQRCREREGTWRSPWPEHDLEPGWFCNPCVQTILDELVGWCWEHDRLTSEGIPDATAYRVNRERMDRGESPPKVMRA